MSVLASSELANSALALARHFAAGGRLLVTAPGRQDHARHVAVEFIHPAITGARSLPAVAVAEAELNQQSEPGDAVLIIGPFGSPVAELDINAALILRVGATESGHELVRWYHLLWELVQLGLEHPGITGGSASRGGDSTSFLYPFLDAAEHDEAALIDSMVQSADAKRAESHALAAETAIANQDGLHAAALAIADRVARGGRVFAIGNGGSSCDAARLVRKLSALGMRATSLAEDPAILTALANDLGVKQIFARQVEASVGPNDVLVAFSTSGSSLNLLKAFDTSAAREAVVIVCAGYDGGPMAAHANVNHQLVTDSSSVHRIQESQGVLIDQLCKLADQAREAKPETGAMA